MLQLIWNNLKTDCLSLINGQTNSSLLLTTICILIILIVFFLLLRHNKKKKQKSIETNRITQESEPDKSLERIISAPKNIDSKERIESKTTISEIKESKHIEEKTIIIKSEPKTVTEEEQSKEKYIGYNPINIFAQTEPLNYPYVLMPKPKCVIKFPRKGRSGRKGYKEQDFKTYIERYFRNSFQVFDDRFILTKNSKTPFEPDFTLIDEKNGINIFIDIEIDEPYEGINDIKNRKATHYQYSDNNRNNAFKNRGWVVIRFAEIQVHKDPDSCCKFIADVIKSINPAFNVPDILLKNKIFPVRQWTKEEAERWSIERYRENYLDITRFGLTGESQGLTGIEETELGNKIEEQVKDDIFISTENKVKTTNTLIEKIYSAINSNKFISFSSNNIKTVVKPIKILESELTAFCYVKNRELVFHVSEIKDLQLKDKYFTLRVAGPTVGIDQIANAVNTAINYNMYIRMKYTRTSWTTYSVDNETGEIVIADRVEAEESVRTISNIQLAINHLEDQDLWFTPDERYITAYCHRREAERMFRFDRVGEIEILDI